MQLIAFEATPRERETSKTKSEQNKCGWLWNRILLIVKISPKCVVGIREGIKVRKHIQLGKRLALRIGVIEAIPGYPQRPVS